MKLSFDRGTITIEGVHSDREASILPGTLWDPRVRCYRAPASAYLPIRGALADAGAPFADEVPRPAAPAGRWNVIGLRPYQDAALSAWQQSGRRGIVAIPTGSGKTRVALAAMARLRVSTLVLVPTRVLLEQWCKQIGLHYSGAVGRFGNGHRGYAPITVATYASAERHMASIGNRFELLVVDEAHNINGAATLETLAMSTAPMRLGLTATPPREPNAQARLRVAIGPTVYRLEIRQLAGSFLAPFDIIGLSVQLDSDEAGRYARERRIFRDFFIPFKRSAPNSSWKDFIEEAKRSDRGMRALSAWRHSKAIVAYPKAKRTAVCKILKRHRGARVLIFTWDNESTYRIARECLVMPITCDIRRTERDDALSRFASGQLRALVSSRVLNEGLDVPDADVAVVVGGSMGEREHVQRIGRLLRPAPGKRALVYELVCDNTCEVSQSKQRSRSLAAD